VLGNDLSHLPDTNSRAAELRALMIDKRCLLIIDDVVSVQQVKALNVGGAGCVRLITTCQADEITYAFKARRFVVDKMSEEEALDLLTEWAGMLPDVYLPTVKEIIKRLSYLPLSIALIGAQARQGITWLRLLEVLREEQGPIAVLNLDSEQVRATALALVMNLALSRFGGAKLQRSALLGAFIPSAGASFSAEAVAACWETALEDAEESLKMLVDSALVQQTPHGYALHPALQAHLCRAANPNALAEAKGRVRSYYLSLVERPDAEAQVDAQLAQIMAVLKSLGDADPQEATLFVDALMAYFERRGLWANLVTLATAAVETAEKSGDKLRQHPYLADLGYAHAILGHHTDARHYFERALTLCRDLGDPVGEAMALNNIGATYERESNYERAIEYYETSLMIRSELGVQDEIADSLNNVAGVLFWQGRLDDALAAWQRVLDIYDSTGSRAGQAQTWLNIGATYERLGDDEAALQAYQRSRAIYANLGNRQGESQTLNNLGIIYLNRGDAARALEHYELSLEIKEDINDRTGQAHTLNNIAFVYEQDGRLSTALSYYERSLRLLEALDDPRAEVVRENIATLRDKMDEAEEE
jgi:tetratricopeptide (TPR) repeat protein